MKTRALLVLPAALMATSTLVGSARAETVCTTIDEFNALMSGSGEALDKVTLTFDVTGVNPADFAGSKGCLVDFTDNSCALGAAANLKVYGPDDPPNLAHPSGSLKFEFGNQCCAAPPCQGEGWAEPNASAQIFFDGTEQCTVTAWVDPGTIGYKLECNSGVFEGVGDNTDGLKVNQIAALSRVDGGWLIPNGVSLANEVCFEQGPPDPNQPVSIDVPVLEDVTAAMGLAGVYPVTADLAVGADDSEIYLKFDLSGVPGTIQKAEIMLHQSDDGSADGDGGDAFAVPDSSWSETSLTWSTRPVSEGGSLARQGPISAFDWYRWDVTAAIDGSDVQSFAIKPQPSDANSAHFFSKEGSSTSAPFLRVEYIPGEGTGGDASTGAGTGGGAGGSGGSGNAGATVGATTGSGFAADDTDPGESMGCACRAAPRPRADDGILFAGALGIALALRRRRR
jgi:large repetitive protein